MKLAATIARYLLGLMFTVFGLNGIGFHFIHQPPPPTPQGGAFMGAMAGSHYFTMVFAIQLIAGILLLVNRYVPLALTLLAAVIANILNYHILMDQPGIVAGLVAAILWVLVFLSVRGAFRGILASRTVPESL